MVAVRNHSRSLSVGWTDFCQRLSPPCSYCDCVHARSRWRRMCGRRQGILLQGARYCRTECLEGALTELLGQARTGSRRETIAPHRIPLGLILLSRQQLTAAQLRTALEAQRGAGRGKIGAWVQELGFASEQQVTAALARQWSCPVLRAGTMAIATSRLPAIPMPLLEFFQMMPVELVQATGTLLMAFSEGIDYTMLYAIERMLGYRTEPCLVSPSILRKSFQTAAQRRVSSDVIFERLEDSGECAHIIGNYCAKVGAVEVRFAQCGEHLWVRLERLRQEAVNLVLRVSPEQSGAGPNFHSTAAALV